MVLTGFILFLVYGLGYAWSRPNLHIEVGDVVEWSWNTEVPGFAGYAVFQTENYTQTSYNGYGFTSGAARPKGTFYKLS